MKITRKFLTAILAIFALICVSPPVHAMSDITLPTTPENSFRVTITVDYPDDFNEKVELHVDGSTYYILQQDGYSTEISLAPGSHTMKVLSPTNISKRYAFEYPGTLQLDANENVIIIVHDTTKATDDEEELHDNGETAAREEETMPAPEEFDFSDGKNYGTIIISRKTYPAIQNATLRLVGNEDIYDIDLLQSYMGRSIVKLPPGSYYESSSISVELDSAATKPEDLSFLWAHEGDLSFFGYYYEIEAGETIHLDDLMIMMSQNSNITEVNSNALFLPQLLSTLESVRESHWQEELESAYPERFETEESETIATAEPIQNTNNGSAALIVIVIVLFAILAGGTLLIWHRKTKH